MIIKMVVFFRLERASQELLSLTLGLQETVNSNT